MIAVSVARPQELIPLEYQRLKECARTVLAGEGVKEAKIVLAFVDDATIAGLNKRFLEHEGPTDVITFQHGEIFISVETARTHARRFGTSFDSELRLYIAHGLLHLHGFDDRDVVEAARMKRTQEKLVAAADGTHTG